VTELDPQVLGAIMALLDELKGDWEYGGEIAPDTRFIADLGLESLEIVVLSTMIQQRYGRLPVPAYFDDIGRRPIEDLVDFVCTHRQPAPQEA
jgi:acyl carrier protein